MVNLKAELKKFGIKGEKTGWTYIELPQKIANQIKSGCKKSFRVKGKIDSYNFKAIAIIPMGEGNFIFPINGVIRKAIKKIQGALVNLELEEDIEPLKLNIEMLACLKDVPEALINFNKLPLSHKNWFSNWVNSAKTSATTAKRIASVLNAFETQMSFAEMIKLYRNNNNIIQ